MELILEPDYSFEMSYGCPLDSCCVIDCDFCGIDGACIDIN